MNDFRGDLSDISAIKASLTVTSVIVSADVSVRSSVSLSAEVLVSSPRKIFISLSNKIFSESKYPKKDVRIQF